MHLSLVRKARQVSIAIVGTELWTHSQRESQDFESQPLYRAAAFFADQGGAFEVVEAATFWVEGAAGLTAALFLFVSIDVFLLLLLLSLSLSLSLSVSCSYFVSESMDQHS